MKAGNSNYERPAPASVRNRTCAELLGATRWWIGYLIAFPIARLGRPALERVTPLAAIDWLESKVPQQVGFGGIVVLRLFMPVDLVSIALKLLKPLRLRPYAVASLIGIVPFASIRSFAGGQLCSGRFLTFTMAVAGLTAVALVVRACGNRAGDAPGCWRAVRSPPRQRYARPLIGYPLLITN